MSFNFDDPIIVMNRTTPYPQKTDIFTIINGKIQLTEKPDSFQRFPEVKNTANNSLYYEITSGIPSDNQFICDYTNSLLTFNSSQNGKTISAQYYSMGVAFIPASKVYTLEENGNVIETLEDKVNEVNGIIDQGNSKITEIDNKIISIQQQYDDDYNNWDTQIINIINNTVNAINLTDVATNNASLATLNSNNEIAKINSAIYSTQIIFKNPVATYANIITTYPTPSIGWTTMTEDTGRRYRWDGSIWVYIDTVSLNAVTLNTNNIGDLINLNTTNKTNLVNSINEVNSNIKDEYWSSSFDSGIIINHNLNDYPIAVIVGENTFGHGGFGDYDFNTKYQVLNKLEYIDTNNIRLFLSETYIGTASIVQNSQTSYTISFASEDTVLNIILK